MRLPMGSAIQPLNDVKFNRSEADYCTENLLPSHLVHFFGGLSLLMTCPHSAHLYFFISPDSAPETPLNGALEEELAAPEAAPAFVCADASAEFMQAFDFEVSAEFMQAFDFEVSAEFMHAFDPDASAEFLHALALELSMEFLQALPVEVSIEFLALIPAHSAEFVAAFEVAAFADSTLFAPELRWLFCSSLRLHLSGLPQPFTEFVILTSRFLIALVLPLNDFLYARAAKGYPSVKVDYMNNSPDCK